MNVIQGLIVAGLVGNCIVLLPVPGRAHSGDWCRVRKTFMPLARIRSIAVLSRWLCQDVATGAAEVGWLADQPKSTRTICTLLAASALRCLSNIAFGVWPFQYISHIACICTPSCGTAGAAVAVAVVTAAAAAVFFFFLAEASAVGLAASAVVAACAVPPIAPPTRPDTAMTAATKNLRFILAPHFFPTS